MVTTPGPATVAYFSMEIALDPSMPTYSGGLGVLAGDTLRAAADLGAPMVGITLVHRKGYFEQHLDAQGTQSESATDWKPEEFLEPVGPMATANIEGREIRIRAWRYLIKGVRGHVVPVYLLDAAVAGNSPWDQELTDHLYGGDAHYRLCQEVILGMSGVELLGNLGLAQIETYHMNEGHAALLTLALVERQMAGRPGFANASDLQAVRHQCVFTTHTPVPAGQDQFPRYLVHQVLGEPRAAALEATGAYVDGALNMTLLALIGSRYVNGVAMQHGEVSRSMFPKYPIRAITNGVHAVTWTSPEFAKLYDRHIPEWRHDNLYLRYAIGISTGEVREAHS
ncbi:MAG: alpha-glucan family phosphorylase, partial [Candidatus Solibacter sp.]